LRIVNGTAEARAQLLQRRRLDEICLPAAAQLKLEQVFGGGVTAEQAARRIVEDVRSRGDAAVRRFGRAFDGVTPRRFEVSAAERRRAARAVDPELRLALELAAQRVWDFHDRQRQNSWMTFDEGMAGQLVQPIETVGIYAPGGIISYPSTVIMTAVPALVAGVSDILLVTPPQPDGRVAALTLVAAEIACVDRVFAIGGAQAIAAFAYGTRTVPRVDKIFGPGSLMVQLAKKAVYGDVGIDAIQGPTETLLIADDSADAALCAADLLAQGEHDPLASAVMLTTSAALAEQTAAEVERRLGRLERADIARQALENNGGIGVVESVEEALELANEYAPEHLCLLVRDAASHLGLVRNAGGVFLGEDTAEALADYIAGPSHVMPTGGSARFSSPVNVSDFMKVTSVVGLTRNAALELIPFAAAIADEEGLTAHAGALRARRRIKG